MAISAATVTGDFSGFIPANIAEPIFEKAARISAVQRLSPRVPLSYKGESIPVVTGRPQAGWVSEGNAKPATVGTMSLLDLVPKKLSAIAVVSAEVVRANPGGYVSSLENAFAEAFAVAFDLAALYDRGPDGTVAGGPFGTNVGATTKAVELGGNSKANGGRFKDLVDALALIVRDKDASGRAYSLTGWALDNVCEPILLDSVDSNGRPLFVDTPLDQTTAAMFEPNDPTPARPGRLIGRPAFMSEGLGDEVTDVGQGIVGFGGDFRGLTAWGAVGGIEYRVSTEATVTINGSLASLFEKNLVAILAEAEYGFVCADADGFVKLTNDIGISSS